MTTQPTYQESKRVAEASREADWKQPSFGRELFMGNLQLDLIHPQPELPARSIEDGERFLERLRVFLTEHVDPLEIERDAKIPERVLDGLKKIGTLGIKIPQGGRRARPLAGPLQQGARARGAVERFACRPAQRASVDRPP